MSCTALFAPILDRVRRFLERTGMSDPGNEPAVAHEAEFEALAVELFARQYEHVAPYRHWCDRLGVRPDHLRRWQDIPALPTGAFRDFEITSLEPAERQRTFFSSGTSGQRRSRHFHDADSCALYELSLRLWFGPHALADRPAGLAWLFLTPPPAAAPDSSLVHMFETLRQTSSGGEGAVVGTVQPEGSWVLDYRAAGRFLEAQLEHTRPVFVLGTAFALVHLIEAMAAAGTVLRLPPGSRVLETGGYKGRSRALPRSELHRSIATHLGVAADHILGEYGMSELSSQAYDLRIGGGPEPDQARRTPAAAGLSPLEPVREDAVGLHEPRPGARVAGPPGRLGARVGDPQGRRGEARFMAGVHVGKDEAAERVPQEQAPDHPARVQPRVYRFPPWARARVIAPETGLEVAEGDHGLLRVFDLANVRSVLALQTEDLAVRRGDGFELVGRAAGAEARGCSLRSA